jgi:competence ComEA-like helix-hairpin-helix protein
MKDWLKEYFTFSEKEQRGIAILLGLICLSVAYRHVAPLVKSQPEYDSEAFRQQVRQFLSVTSESQGANPKQQVAGAYSDSLMTGPTQVMSAEQFYFDPNTLNEEGWKKTGLNARVIRNILRYRDKGGTFHSGEDLRKIYGMEDSVYDRLAPYLVFVKPEKEKPKEPFDKPVIKNFTPTDSSTARSIQVIGMNSADSADFESLPGIGSGFASRIVRYREKLGGFVTREQIMEVKGLDSSKFLQIRDLLVADTVGIRKMDLNAVTFKEMLRHPYFEYYLVKAIFNYKDRVKVFDSIGQLRNIETIYPELYEKISPYLEVRHKAEER